MKKVFNMITLLFLICLCLLSSCNKSKQNETSNTQTENDYFLFDLNEKINTFDVDENGNIYYLSYKEQTKTGINDDGVEYCYFLCVNPASKKLKLTLQYISSLCNYLLIQEDNMALSSWDIQTDNKLFNDLYEIYANGDIQFTYPDDLYKEDLLKFISGEIELEKLIKDSNHRMDIYLNE